MVKERKPYGYWSVKENCKKDIELCDYNLMLFKEKHNRGYVSLRDNGWLDEFFPDRKKFNFWKTQSKTQIFEKSKEYKTQSEFQSRCNEAYTISKENGWLEEFYDIRRNLTYEECENVVGTFNSYSELYQQDVSVLMKIQSKGWDELISHWELPYSHKNLKWTREKCEEEISKLTYFNDLQGTSLLGALKRNGWFDELTKNLIRQVSVPYTEEQVIDEALKYKTRNDFRVGSPGQYGAAKRLDIMEMVTKHMGKSLIEKQYTKEEILESALKYKNQRDWKDNEPSIFTCAVGYNKKTASEENKQFWLTCISHMEYIYKPNGYWTYEKCEEITKDYTVHSEFYKDHPNVYSAIHKNNWVELLNHMQHVTMNGNVRQFSEDFDTIEKCTEEALKYKTRSEMHKNSNYAHKTILKNGWEKVCFVHMKRQMTLKERVIYVFEFNTTTPKYAYVGLTCQIERRKNAHLYGTEKSKSSVFEKIKETNVTPEFKILTTKPIKEEDAPEMEAMWIGEYRDMGFTLLNKAKAGSLGAGKSKFTYDYFVKMKEGCENREEYSKKIPSWARSIAIENNWWVELTSDMVKTKKMNGEWNIEDALEEVKNYECVGHLQKNKAGLYKFLERNNLLKVVFPKTFNELKKEKYGDKEECQKEALKYESRRDFRIKSSSFYESSRKNGWINEICSHMVKIKPSIWTPELIKEKSSECRNRSEFEKKYSGGYKMAKKLNLLDEIFPIKPKREVVFLKPFSENDTRKIMWNIDLVREKSLECRTKSEFQIKYSGGHKVAKKYGILNDLFPVEDRPIRKSIWSYDLVKEKSSECRNVSEFRKKYSGAEKAAKRYGWLDELFPKEKLILEEEMV
jgi:hypothetical protein